MSGEIGTRMQPGRADPDTALFLKQRWRKRHVNPPGPLSVFETEDGADVFVTEDDLDIFVTEGPV